MSFTGRGLQRHRGQKEKGLAQQVFACVLRGIGWWCSTGRQRWTARVRHVCKCAHWPGGKGEGVAAQAEEACLLHASQNRTCLLSSQVWLRGPEKRCLVSCCLTICYASLAHVPQSDDSPHSVPHSDDSPQCASL